ncbi:hypothetical protein HF521_003003 [Silurus meridionalis]|uniref:Matrix metalloproteinase-14 n=1 Tax=Silurus meridionalis TaxID=175797 RepID=A0A8T0B3G6_SILME|nr:hypothetical protein HF521_003003 [Silurus meridionalis]
MGLFGLVCLFAHFAPLYLGAPLLQVEQGDVTSHQSKKLQDDMLLAVKYIERFYSFQTGPPGHRKRSHPFFSSKLKDMQSFFGLNQTGILDTETLSIIKTPRCGVPDVEEYVYNRGNRWKKNVISYSIGKYTSDLPIATVDSLIGAALDVWAKASPLRFFRSSSQQADIMVEFGSKWHTSSWPSVTSPYFSSLNWNFPFNRWYTSFLYPRAIKDKCDPDLSFDSVTNVGASILFFKDRYLWIRHNRKHIREGPINSFLPKINSTIDAAYWFPQTSMTFLFTGSSYWTVKDFGRKSWRKKISSFGFPASVHHIDAAVHIPKNHTLFFTQDQYWRYNEEKKALEESNPRIISTDFPGIKSPISAAVYKDGFLHFFVGAEVYKYDVMVKKVILIKKANSWLGC